MAEINKSDKSLFSRISIAVVDDCEFIREGINSVLARNGVKHIGVYSSAMQLLEDLDAGLNYNFYIIDLELKNVDIFLLIEMIHEREGYVIVDMAHDEILTLRRLLDYDVDGIIYKSGGGKEIVAAINEILRGNNYYCREVRTILKIARDDSAHPTPRELEVLQHLSLGKTSREIAAAMFVSENTVEAHRKSLFAKLGALNGIDLIVKAIRKGYLKNGGG